MFTNVTDLPINLKSLSWTLGKMIVRICSQATGMIFCLVIQYNIRPPYSGHHLFVSNEGPDTITTRCFLFEWMTSGCFLCCCLASTALMWQLELHGGAAVLFDSVGLLPLTENFYHEYQHYLLLRRADLDQDCSLLARAAPTKDFVSRLAVVSTSH